jgi:hypothetical protein
MSFVCDADELTDVAQEIDVSVATETPTELFYISKGRSLKSLWYSVLG